MLIQGQLVTLRTARLQDREKAYRWMAESDVTPLMMGPPVFSDAPVPGFGQFCADYPDSFFTDIGDGEGRSFVILAHGDDVGHISYSNISREHWLAELDIWMASLAWCGYGYGPDALAALAGHLREEYGFHQFLMRPSRRNPRAIRAYQRAGFNVVDPVSALPETHRDRGCDYDDTIFLLKVYDVA
jgi:RimJ/RimL family protein N-acetyltransferase